MKDLPNSQLTDQAPRSAHTCHIPVMGTGFTIDTPLKVARYGIESVISLVDDELIEQMRGYHSSRNGIAYEPITRNDDDYRARRICAFLNLIAGLVEQQVAEMKSQQFVAGSDLTRYFELLPDCELRMQYRQMLGESDPDQRAKLEHELRQQVVPGKINVNIMTKMDRLGYRSGQQLPAAYSDSLAAVRGFALSRLNSAVVLSAGLNQRLFSYMAQLDSFFPAGSRAPRKQVIIKVSDFRSALIQGKLLAKRGIWVSEFRVESGINCGGHAFIDKGQLMGPVLQEFSDNLSSMEQELRLLYGKALERMNLSDPWQPPRIRLSTQGGIGTSEEAQMLHMKYGIDSTGWGTPFLLVPEVTNLEPADLCKLCSATADGVYLSDASPLGVPFWNLRNSPSELARLERIARNTPGSRCSKGYAASSTEFGPTPLCVSSNRYQRSKLAEIAKSGMSQAVRDEAVARVVAKACICHDLAGNATRPYEIDKAATPAICCGPGIADFKGPFSLERILDHIYGRISLASVRRPHMFIREIRLYVNYLKQRVKAGREQLPTESLQHILDNLAGGVSYYRATANKLIADRRKRFLADLDRLSRSIAKLQASTAPQPQKS